MDKKDQFRKSSKLVCSQYIAQMYNYAGTDLKKKRSDRFMSPVDIATSPALRRVFNVKEII